MERIRYITFREPDENGKLRHFVLQKEFPHNLGRVDNQPNLTSLAQGTIPGYNLWIVSVGTIRGNTVYYYPKHEIDMANIFNNMAIWYLNERIKKNEKLYEKFKVK